MCAETIRKSGLPAVGDLAWGAHFCHFYDTRESLLDTVVPYLRAGLDGNEGCLWIVAQPFDTVAKNAVREAIPDYDEQLSAGRMEVVPCSQWYLENNVFDSRRVIEAWKAKHDQALKNGFAGLRVAADASWVRPHQLDPFIDYENAVDGVIAQRHMIVMCSHTVDGSKPNTILDLARAHKFSITRRENGWEARENPCHRQSESGSLELHRELEATVAKHGREQRESNEALRHENAERRRAEEELHANLWFLEGMDQANRAMQGTNDLEQVTRDVLEATLSVFRCDRAWLVYPCDPEAESWRAVMGRFRPEYPIYQTPVKMHPEMAGVLGSVLASTHPVTYGPEGDHPLPPKTSKHFQVQSAVGLAIYPKTGKPYLFGLHQCTHGRVWTAPEKRLLEAIGGRLADALTSLLAFRDLQASEARFRTFVDHATDAFLLHDDQGTIRDANRQACESLLYSREELIGMTPRDFDLNAESFVGQIRERLETEEVVVFETRFRRKDGSEFPVEVRIRRFTQGGSRHALSLCQDISDRKRAEEKLTLFRALLEQTNDAIEVIDPETGRFLDVNEKACRALGYTREEYLTLTVSDIGPEVANRPWRERIDELRRSGSRVFETQHLRKDGSVFPVEVSDHYIRLDRDYELAVVRDITERKQAERRLIESHSLLNAVVEGTPDIVFVKDLQGHYLMINSAGAEFVGRTVEEVVGKDDTELLPPESARSIMDLDREIMESGESRTFEETLTVNGRTRTCLSTKSVYRDPQGKVHGLLGISRDITELKRMQGQFIQAQRMEAVGRLAGGVAHEFNNLLTVINGYSELLQTRVADDGPTQQIVAEIRKSGERAAKLVGQLLAFGRKQMLQPRMVALNTMLCDLLKLLRPAIGENVELSFVPAGSLGLVRVDPGQFQQALVSLVINAGDSMPHGGRLTIETQNTELDDNYVARHPQVRPGPYVLVSVTDSGQGMDDTALGHLFEPFFSPEGLGKGHGTGLGLAMVYGFVKQSGGHIEVSSKLGRGTTFMLYLPRADSSSAFGPVVKAPEKPSEGCETILLAEDEDAVRTLVSHLLRSNGYTVLEARDGEEAVVVAQGREGPIHLLLTDVVMPGLSGRQLADRLLEARPDLRVLFMSGYTDQELMRQGLAGETVDFIRKPFSLADLTRKVRQVLRAER